MSEPRHEEPADRKQERAPHPEDPRKPDSPTDVKKRSWGYILKKTYREFLDDQATDLAAALTYYAVLAVFPALLAIVSIIGLFSDPETTVQAMLDFLAGMLPPDSLAIIEEPLSNLARSPSAGLAFVVGIVGALWSASGYVTAFSRAMNRVYEIDEGRPFWKLRPAMLGITVIGIVAAVIAAALVALSGPVAEQVGSALGLSDVAVAVWDVAKWIIVAFLAVAIVAILYYATPNVKQPKFRWMSLGALVALVTWAAASVGFGFYVLNFSSYQATYGVIGGVIVFLLWVWISNLALLFGAELDAEVERGRQLQAGIEAEEAIQLPPRDTRVSEKRQKKREEEIADGRRLRETEGGSERESDDELVSGRRDQ
ncbi:YihY/virulence factor BrkB family protein [Microbacterium immunditiarum]|uniref:Membrane protein n=1 Tax=Microbacterium immunditiarum TaxID=337480 RepID=A0A7Y9GL48_9MICO|nr:YihY/virulence factor BrkB family protein [Microbacterium immunditiarum]NYE18484.1 membrane protein [Microbacterium immunditiarum]